jgi:hypothetical protein
MPPIARRVFGIVSLTAIAATSFVDGLQYSVVSFCRFWL